VTAAVIAFGIVSGLLRYLQRHTYTAFGVYRIVLGAVLLLAVGAGFISK